MASAANGSDCDDELRSNYRFEDHCVYGAQLCLTEAARRKRMRLLGFERVAFEPGESLTADLRLLAGFDASEGQWRIAKGTYRVALGKSANHFVLTGGAPLASRLFGR